MGSSLEPWTGHGLALHPVDLATLDALRREDLQTARTRCPKLPLTEFLVSSRCVRTWQRRYQQIRDQPADASWVTRLVVLSATNEVVGRAGFHGAPDSTGAVEIGYEIDPEYRRRGYGTRAIGIMLEVAQNEPGVNAVRASVSPANSVSRQMVLGQGFVQVGEEMDDEDGLEEVFELQFQHRDAGDPDASGPHTRVGRGA